MIIELLTGAGLEILVTFSEDRRVEEYRWISTVLQDPYPIPDQQNNLQYAPYIDPPIQGYSYRKADSNIYYWDDSDCTECLDNYKVTNWMSNNTFRFIDYPLEPRLENEEEIVFNTCLVNTISNKESFCINWSLTSNESVIINYKLIKEIGVTINE